MATETEKVDCWNRVFWRKLNTAHSKCLLSLMPLLESKNSCLIILLREQQPPITTSKTSFAGSSELAVMVAKSKEAKWHFQAYDKSTNYFPVSWYLATLRWHGQLSLNGGTF